MLTAGGAHQGIRNSRNLLQHQCLQWGGGGSQQLSLHILNLYIFGELFLCVLFFVFVCSGFTFFFVLFYQKRLKTEVGAKYVFLFPLESRKYICTGKCTWASQAQRFNIKAIRSIMRLTRKLPLLVPFLFAFLNSCFEMWHMVGLVWWEMKETSIGKG